MVQSGMLEDECRKLNEIFITYITANRPFVILKSAAGLDGRIAAETGDSKWISNDKSRHFVHQIRDRVDGILVGVGTALQDNPSLTTRLPNRRGKDPARIIVDSRLSISPSAQVFNLDSKAPTIVATTEGASHKKIEILERRGAQVIIVPSRKHVDLPRLMDALAEREITSVLIEGGSRINTSALESGIVDKVMFFYAPRIIGGGNAPLLFGGTGVASGEGRDSIARYSDTPIRRRCYGGRIY